MKLRNLAISVSVAFSVNAFAGFVTYTPDEEVFHDVKLSKEAQVKLGEREVTMPRIGKGLRVKETIFGTFDVSVVELFASSPEKFVRTEAEAISSLQQSEVITLTQTFMRNVEASKIEGAYADGFARNKAVLDEAGLSVKTSPIKDLLKKIRESDDISKGERMTVTLVRSGDTWNMVFDYGTLEPLHIEGNAGLGKVFLALWFGNTGDDAGLTALKAALLSGK